MSGKLENKNESGWDVDDDDWDDWGDTKNDLIEETQSQQDPNQHSYNKEKMKSGSIETNKSTKIFEPNSSKSYNNDVNTELSPQEQRQQPQETQNRPSGWGSLFGGVVSSVLNTANELTSTVSHGLDKVIGVPDPADLARINTMEESKVKAHDQVDQFYSNDIDDTSSTFGLGLVNNMTSLGSKVLNTGLDTLEGIGKKTMNILQENDPLLKSKLKKLGLDQEKPNLSEVLKEAKKENEVLEQSLKELNLEKSRAQLRFEILFENKCGLAHLEALEILSRESELKLQALKESVSGKAFEDLIETINEVKELMELEDIEDDAEREDYDKDELNTNLRQAIEDTELQIQFDEIVNLWSNCTTWLNSEESKDLDAQTIFAKSITSLAETCALEILKLHKIAELLLIKEHHSTANEVDGIVQLCKQFNMHLQTVANCFAARLSNHPDLDNAKTHINTLFTEMLQSRQQIEKAFHLFLPILQIGAV